LDHGALVHLFGNWHYRRLPRIQTAGTLIPHHRGDCFLLSLAPLHCGARGWEVVALFLVGLALVLSELMLHPGTIIPDHGMMLISPRCFGPWLTATLGTIIPTRE